MRLPSYTIRTVAPEKTNKNYCYPTNQALIISGSCCLPNCVGYVNGAFIEMFGSSRLSTGNACTLYPHTQDGYRRSKTPVLGAVACWGAYYHNKWGHVGIVVGIFQSYITIAQSNYGGTFFEVVRCYKMANGGYRSAGGMESFQGFILPPDGYTYGGIMGKTTTASSGKTVEQLAQEVIAGKWGNGSDRKNRLTKAGYSYTAVQKRVNELASGKTNGKTVEQLAQEVIAGKWGNGRERKNRLTKAGYSYTAVQKRVEELLR